MGSEILEVLNQFGSGGGGDPGNNVVRFLLAAFFWAVLALLARQEYARAKNKKDFFIFVAALLGASREFVMFFLQYGHYRGLVPQFISYSIFPPLEHTLTDLSRVLLGFSYLNYLLPNKKVAKYFGLGGTVLFLALYLVTAPLWVRFISENAHLFANSNPGFGKFWGDMAYRVCGSLTMAVVMVSLVAYRDRDKKLSRILLVGFLFLFLDEFLMIFNLATGDAPLREIMGPIRHNLGIWAIPLFVAAYWSELSQNLLDEKSKTEGILEAIGEGILIVDSDTGEVVYRNSAHTKIVDEADYQKAASLCRPGQIGSAAKQVKFGDKDVEYGCYPLKDADGKVVSIISVLRDISKRTKAEKGLSESEERYRSLVDNIDMGITLIDENFKVLMANKTQGVLLEKDPNSYLGKNCFLEFESREEVCSHCPGKVAMSTNKPAVAETVGIKPDGSQIHVRIQAFPALVKDGVPHGFIEVVEDITELKTARAEREKLENKLMQVQKLESLGILAGGIAHDFNNLLMGMLGNVDLALLKANNESPLRPYLQRIEVAAQRAADLTNQMLAYSGKGRFIIEPISVSRLVEEMGYLLETVVKKGAILKYNLAPNLPTVMADATQLRQVVMNLITNASDAIGDRSGVISVSTGMVEADRSYLSAAYLDETLPEGFYVYVEVGDTGVGMDKQTVERIFDPFFTTKTTGRGLGLAAVLGIVRGHQGALKVYSEPGRGTTFKVLLPISKEAHVEPKHFHEVEKSPILHDEDCDTILVVDDDETVRSVAKMMLEESGYCVITANDGVEGVLRFSENQKSIKLVLLDMTMPHMDGEECFRRLRMIKPDVKVILSSGYNEMDAVNRFAGKGLCGFIQKPYRSQALLDKIAEAIRQ